MTASLDGPDHCASPSTTSPDGGGSKTAFLQHPKSGSSCRMQPESPRPRPPRRRLPRAPAFYPVSTRSRRDGWTVQRQADFLGMLAETGSVMGACEAVGMSRNSAYELRARPGAESFAAAWDAALGGPVPKVTVRAREFFGESELVHPVMFRGRYRGSWCRPDGTALLSWRADTIAPAAGDTVTPGT